MQATDSRETEIGCCSSSELARVMSSRDTGRSSQKKLIYKVGFEQEGDGEREAEVGGRDCLKQKQFRWRPRGRRERDLSSFS